jgi:hypothetical protein
MKKTQKNQKDNKIKKAIRGLLRGEKQVNLVKKYKIKKSDMSKYAKVAKIAKDLLIYESLLYDEVLKRLPAVRDKFLMYENDCINCEMLARIQEELKTAITTDIFLQIRNFDINFDP